MSVPRVIKAIVGFYRIDSEAYRSRIPINNDLRTVESLKRHLVEFLGLKELATKFGLGMVISNLSSTGCRKEWEEKPKILQ